MPEVLKTSEVISCPACAKETSCKSTKIQTLKSHKLKHKISI